MAKIILTLGDKLLREIPLSKERMKIGRRGQNDIVIGDLSISGEHAVIVSTDHDAYLEDLNSTNGTKVNGQPVKKHYLRDQDCIELAAYRLHYVTHKDEDALPRVKLTVLSGSKAGSEIVVNKTIVTIGKPGLLTAVILLRSDGYYLAAVEGSSCLRLNGLEVTSDPKKLNNGDFIEMAGDHVRVNFT